VWNKLDLPGAGVRELAGHDRGLGISALCGEGLDELRRALALALAPERAAGEGTGLSRELAARHLDALDRARGELEAGLAAFRDGAFQDLLAEHLRGACAALDAILGATTPEDVLERIFARFCLGK